MLLNLIGSFPLAPLYWLQAIISAFFAILFLQSGIDKIANQKENLDWLLGHFAKSPLSGAVPFLLTTITVVEVIAGGTSLAAVGQSLYFKEFDFAILGTTFSAVALLMLFFGQRIAKDYEGAGNLVPYFILAVLNLYFLL